MEIQEEIIELLKHIIKLQTTEDTFKTQAGIKITSKTYSILYTIFNDTYINKINEHLSILYRLLFCTFNKNQESAYYILSGFINYGRSNTGKKFKPMIDHLAIEAFDEFILLGGWSILKKCVTILNYTISEFHHEPLFIHILSRVIHQLYDDSHTNDSNDISELCCCLPRERSYTWGWFSYYVAHAFYGGLHACGNKIQARTMRYYLKHYRKMITALRRTIYTTDTFTQTIYQDYCRGIPQKNTNTNNLAASINVMDDGLINYFIELNSSEYEWANNLTNKVLGVPSKQISLEADMPDTSGEMTPSLQDTSNIDDELVIISTSMEEQAAVTNDTITNDTITNDTITNNTITNDTTTNDTITNNTITNDTIKKEKTTLTEADEGDVPQQAGGIWGGLAPLFNWFSWS